MPGGHALRRALRPAPKALVVVAEGAVDSQPLRDSDHQRVGVLGACIEGAVAVDGKGLRRCTRITALPSRTRAERILQHRGGAVGLGRDGPCHSWWWRSRRPAASPHRGTKYIGRHRMAAVAGLADHAGVRDVRLPVGVDVPGHLDHPAGDLFRIDAVVGQIVGVVAVGAALLGATQVVIAAIRVLNCSA